MQKKSFKSEEAKLLGYKYFNDGNYSEALKYFSKAID